MGDILEKIFAIILIVILMFFFPLLDSFERMDDLAYMTAYTAVREFVDEVRSTGVIKHESYAKFLQRLNSTGNKYDIEMVHRKMVYDPVTNNSGETNYIRLDNELNKEQILAEMGYYELVGNELVDKQPTQYYDDFEIGDYFYVSVKNSTTTAASTLKKIVYGNNVNDLVIAIPYGGMVQETETIGNEEYIDESVTVAPTEYEDLLVNVAEVGDYVDYNIIGGQYTVSTTNRSWLWNDKDNNKVYSSGEEKIEYKDILWRVLKNDGNSVTLVSATAIDNIVLKGANGYVYGPIELNQICSEVYGGRNLNVEDVNELLKGDRNWGDNENNWIYCGNDGDAMHAVPAGMRTIGELENSGEIGTTPISSENRFTPISGKLMEEYTSNYYYYYNTNTIADGKTKEVIFSGNSYWLASNCTLAQFGQGTPDVDYDVRFVASDRVTVDWLYDSKKSVNTVSYGLRPVVVLNSSKRVKNASAEGDTASSAWELK